MLGGAAAIALSGAAMPALAQSQPGFHRFKVGDIEVTSISDGVRPGKLDGKSVARARASSNFRMRWPPTACRATRSPRRFNTLAVKNGNSLFVIDTGNGANTLAAGTGTGGGEFHAPQAMTRRTSRP